MPHMMNKHCAEENLCKDKDKKKKKTEVEWGLWLIKLDVAELEENESIWVRHIS